MKSLLLTAFDPFAHYIMNPSWEVVQALPETINNYHIHKLRVPNIFGLAPRLLLESEFAANDLPTPANIVEGNSVFAILQLLQYGDSLALISEPVVRDHLGARLLCRLPIAIDAQLPDFGILTRRGAPLRPLAQAFVEALRAVAREAAKRATRQRARQSFRTDKGGRK